MFFRVTEKKFTESIKTPGVQHDTVCSLTEETMNALQSRKKIKNLVVVHRTRKLKKKSMNFFLPVKVQPQLQVSLLVPETSLSRYLR